MGTLSDTALDPIGISGHEERWQGWKIGEGSNFENFKGVSIAGVASAVLQSEEPPSPKGQIAVTRH